MSKFDFHPSVHPRDKAIIPEVVDQNESISLSHSSLSSKRTLPSQIFHNYGQNMNSALDIAKIIVSGELEIGRIQAISQAHIQEIEAEIQKIIAVSQQEMEKFSQETQEWHEIFNAIVLQLERHPEWTDEIKQQIIQLGITRLKKEK